MFRCYRQIEHSDCGLTCIRMIARSHGIDIPLRHLQEITDINRLGMSLRDITECFSKIKMDSTAVKISLGPVGRMPLPAILYWQQRHFVVLYKVDLKNRKYHIADPAQGKIKYTEEEFKNYWFPEGDKYGLAILADPSAGFREQKFENTNETKKFWKYLKEFLHIHKSNFIFALLVTFLIMAADFVVPILLRRTVDEGIALKNVNLITALLLCQLAIAAGGLVASNIIEWIMTRTGLKMHINMTNSFLEHLARFPISFFDRKVSSDFVQKIGDQSKIKDFLLYFPNTIFTTLLTAIVFSILLFQYSKVIFVIFIFISLLEIGWSTLFINKKKTLNYAEFTKSSENYNHAYELTNGMADLKVNNAESVRISKWKRTQEAINDISLKTTKINMLQNGGQTMISRAKDLLVTGIGALMVIYGDLSLGALMTLGYITGRLSIPFATIGDSISSFQSALLSYQRIDNIIHDDSEARGTRKFTTPTISLKNVYFKYAGASSPFVIKNFSLEIGRGETIALVGESGCGKSTIIKLMLGFYIPQKGSITLSEADVREIDNADWLSHCGVVMQETRIFSGSILENISLSDSEPNIDKATELLHVVGLKDLIATLPMGIYTRIGVSGIEMSGGQKQRLMIARALYNNPDILFLDEATSSLDANNERSIVEKINELSSEKTIIIAAHRLSTVKTADKIVYIENGQIREIGSHEELIKLNGNYMKLVKNQLQLSL